MEAYINLRYFHRKIVIDYHLSKNIGNYHRSAGFLSKSENLEEAKEKLARIIENSHEEKIIISSKLRSRLKGYSKFGLRRLKEIKDSLSHHRPDITFTFKRAE